MKANELKQWDRNPRTISKEQLEKLELGMGEFGDLGGVVYNRTMGCLVGGHQRAKVLPPEAEVVITEHINPPSAVGTVALGHVLYKGEKFGYREVEWDAKKHAAACLMANKAGGDWDLPGLGNLLKDLRDSDFNLDLTGFDKIEIGNLLDVTAALPGEAEEERAKNPREEDYENGSLRKIEIWVAVDQYEGVMEKLLNLGKAWALETNTEIVLRALEVANANTPPTPPNL